MAKRKDHVLAATGELLLEREFPMALHRQGYGRLRSKYGLSRSQVNKVVNYLVDAGKAEVRPHTDRCWHYVAAFPVEENEESAE
jgi:hypothetical protein